MIRGLGLLGMLALALLAGTAQAADVTGAWQVRISISDQEINGKASLKQAGDTLTGWVGPDESDPIPITGTVTGDKITIETHPQPGRTVAFAKCELTLQGDKMTGTIDTDKGKIEFSRTTSNRRFTGQALGY